MEITAVDNPRVKRWSQLLTKKGRDAQQRFLIEGVHLVNEAIISREPIEYILFDLQHGKPNEIEREKAAANIEWIGVSKQVLSKCSDTVTPQGVIAIVHKKKMSLEALLHDSTPLVIAVDRIQDPGNLGTIIRSADAAGADGVVVGAGSVDIYNPKTVRATMGSLFHIPVLEADLTKLLPEVGRQQIDIVSTGLAAATSCYEEDFNAGKWIIVGNEALGVSPEVTKHVQRQIKIPMSGKAESLNVAMATTIILFEAMRQRLHT